ncbi:Carboxypeptidase Y [Trebouxia sp. C0009 RCD-2024]
MACSMKTCVAGTRLAAPAKIQQSRARVATPVAASLRQEVARVAKGAGVGLASLGLALAANAANVKLGADGGGLVFDPSSVTIKAGESVTWTNNVGFPHNVVFDEDDIPEGVKADDLSHEDYLNAPGQKVSSKFSKPGTYGYYCEPHQGAGMAGKVIVQ